MSNAYTTDHLKNVFTFPFKDPRWKEKFLVAIGLSLVSFLLLPYFFVLGYLYEIMRRIIVEKVPPSLPDWDDWGTYFTNGFKLFAMGAIYSMPAIVLMFASQMFLTFWIATTDYAGAEEVWLPILGMPVMYGAMGVGMVLMISSMLVMMVATGHMVAKDEFSAAFQFRQMWRIFRNNIAGYLITFVIVMGLYWAVMMVSQVLMLTVVLCCLYPVVLLVAQTYLFIVGSVLFAEAYREGADKAVADSQDLIEAGVEGTREDDQETPPAE